MKLCATVLIVLLVTVIRNSASSDDVSIFRSEDSCQNNVHFCCHDEGKINFKTILQLHIVHRVGWSVRVYMARGMLQMDNRFLKFSSVIICTISPWYLNGISTHSLLNTEQVMLTLAQASVLMTLIFSHGGKIMWRVHGPILQVPAVVLTPKELCLPNAYRSPPLPSPCLTGLEHSSSNAQFFNSANGVTTYPMISGGCPRSADLAFDLWS
jgi:hypothetical protein